MFDRPVSFWLCYWVQRQFADAKRRSRTLAPLGISDGAGLGTSVIGVVTLVQVPPNAENVFPGGVCIPQSLVESLFDHRKSIEGSSARPEYVFMSSQANLLTVGRRNWEFIVLILTEDIMCYLTPWMLFFPGGSACVFVGQPLDTVKVKMQTFPLLYKNGLFCFVQTFKKEGIQ